MSRNEVPRSTNSACRTHVARILRMSHAYSACRTHPRLAAGIRFPDTDSLSLSHTYTHIHTSAAGFMSETAQ
jgi:hypothetical protein